MPRRKLNLVRDDMDKSIRKARRKMRRARAMYDNTRIRLTPTDYDDWVSITFQNVVSDWEQFLENAFILYALGKESPSGMSARCHATYRTRKSFTQILRGAARYVKWNDPTTIIRLAQNQFHNGEPFTTPLRGSQQQLQDILTTRNAIGHGTEDVIEKFRSLLRRELVNFPSNMTPAAFLLSIHSDRGISYIEYYLRTLETVAALIVPQ